MQLVIDTAGMACSVALIDGNALVDERHDVIARGHAERLIPMIAALSGGGRADSILVGCGPGSFTGVRVGIAAARALGIGWGVPVTGCNSLALIAAGYFASQNSSGVTIVVEGGHGEVFVQPFAQYPFHAVHDLISVPKDAAAALLAGQPLAGNAAPLFAGCATESFHARAGDARFLPEGERVFPPSPVYGRGADAKPMARV